MIREMSSGREKQPRRYGRALAAVALVGGVGLLAYNVPHIFEAISQIDFSKHMDAHTFITEFQKNYGDSITVDKVSGNLITDKQHVHDMSLFRPHDRIHNWSVDGNMYQLHDPNSSATAPIFLDDRFSSVNHQVFLPDHTYGLGGGMESYTVNGQSANIFEVGTVVDETNMQAADNFAHVSQALLGLGGIFGTRRILSK